MWVVYYNGEYDLDDFGNVFTSYGIFDDYDKARESAADYERVTGIITSICFRLP